MPGLPIHHQLSEFTKTHVNQIGDDIQLSHLPSSPSPPAIFPSIRVFSNESTLHIRWPKYWSFSLSISPSNEHPGLISIMDWLHLLAVQGTRKSLLRLCVFGGNTSEEMLCFYCIIPASTQCQSIS